MKTLHKLTAFLLVAVLLLTFALAAPLSASALTTEVNITGCNSFQPDSDGYVIMNFALDDDLVTTTIGNAQANPLYIDAFEASVFLNGVSVGDINDGGNNWNIMFTLNDNRTIDVLISPVRLNVANDITFEIRTAIDIDGVLLNPIKLVRSAATGLWEVPPPPQVNITGCNSFQPNSGGYVIMNFALDDDLVTTTISNAQANPLYIDAFEANVFLNGVSVGDINDGGNNWNIMFTLNDNRTIDVLISPVRLNVANDITFEIRTAIDIDGVLLNPIKLVRSAATGLWEVPPPPQVNITGCNSFTPNSSGQAYINFALDGDFVTNQISQPQETSSPYREAIEASIFLNGISVGNINDGTNDWNIMFIFSARSIDVVTSATRLNLEADITFEVRTPLVIDGVTLNPVKIIRDATSGLWRIETAEEEDEGIKAAVTGGSAVEKVAGQNYYQTSLFFDKTVVTSSLSNIQAPPSEYSAQIKSKMFINGKSIGQWCTQVGHDWAVMVNLQQPSGNHSGYFNIWVDVPNQLGLDPDSVSLFEIREAITIGEVHIQPVALMYNPAAGIWAPYSENHGSAELTNEPMVGNDAIVEVTPDDGYRLAAGGLHYVRTSDGKRFPLYKREGAKTLDPNDSNTYYFTQPDFEYTLEAEFVPADADSIDTAARNFVSVLGVAKTLAPPAGLQFGARALRQITVEGVEYTLDSFGTVLLYDKTGAPVSPFDWPAYINTYPAKGIRVTSTTVIDRSLEQIDFCLRLADIIDTNDYTASAFAAYTAADGSAIELYSAPVSRSYWDVEGNLALAPTATGLDTNNMWSVWVKPQGGTVWRSLPAYNVQVGVQETSDMAVDGERVDSVLVNFDFTGTVDIKATYNNGSITSHEIRPDSYDIDAVLSGSDTLTFSVTQNQAPRKMVVRINDNWFEQCLHIMTNPLETGAPRAYDSNVYVVNPGDSIPLELPPDKDTYYFMPGTHELPTGIWAELDLEEVKNLTSFSLQTGILTDNYFMNGPQSFLIEGKVNKGDEYVTMYNGLANASVGLVTGTFPAFNARYVRIILRGNNANGTEKTGNYLNFASYAKELRLYEATGGNVAQGKAVSGAMIGFEKLTDGNDGTAYTSTHQYGNWHAGESFFISRPGTTLYLAPGSVVKGSLLSDGIDNVTVKGRGYLDCSGNDHRRQLAEGRTGAIWISDGSNCIIDGITVLDPAMWGIIVNFCDNSAIRNVNFFGSVTNADGFHLSGTSNSTIDGCFIRTCDDQFVMYHYGPGSNNDVKNTVIWGDGARSIVLGLGGAQNADITGITFENLDIINQVGVWDMDKHSAVFWIWASGDTSNDISDIAFKNIRIDSFMTPGDSRVFLIRNDAAAPGGATWTAGGKVSNITFEDIVYNGSGERAPVIHGSSATENIEAIRFINYSKNGVPLTQQTLSSLVNIGSYVSDVVVE